MRAPTRAAPRAAAVALVAALALPGAAAADVDGPGTLYELSGRDGEPLSQDQSFRFTGADSEFLASVEQGPLTPGFPVRLHVMVRRDESEAAWVADFSVRSYPLQPGHTYTEVGGDRIEQPSTITDVAVGSRGCQPHRGSVRVDALEVGALDPLTYRQPVRYLDLTFTQSCFQNNDQRFQGVLAGHLVVNHRSTVPLARPTSPTATGAPATPASPRAASTKPPTGRTVTASTVSPTPTPTPTPTSAAQPPPATASGDAPGLVASTTVDPGGTPSPTTVAEPVRRRDDDGGVPWWAWAVLGAVAVGGLGGAGLAVRRGG